MITIEIVKFKKKLKQDNSISVFDIFVGIYNKATQFWT